MRCGCKGLWSNAAQARGHADLALSKPWIELCVFVLRLVSLLGAAAAPILLASATAAALVTVGFGFTALAGAAHGLASVALSLSTCPLRSHERHRLNHYCGDQAKMGDDANQGRVNERDLVRMENGAAE